MSRRTVFEVKVETNGRYFLGSGAGLRGQAWKFVFARGGEKDCEELRKFLSARYGNNRGKSELSQALSSDVILCKNGRSGLALALKEYLEPKSKVIVNGFTCYAVVEAVLAADCVPVYADISRDDLNFNVKTLEKVVDSECRAIIAQNTFGNPVDMAAIEKFAKKHNLVIIEDLAHSAGVRYLDGREAGTVGAATVLSFGKEKMIDAVNGGAVIFRDKIVKKEFQKSRKSDSLRARFYPLFATIYRGLPAPIRKAWMGLLLKIHWVERSADNKLDLEHGIAPWQARIALEQLKTLNPKGEKPLRDFALVNNREEVLRELRENGYFFDGFWYEKPVSPARYYKKVHFPEEQCPVAVEVSAKIVNFPTYYTKSELKEAYKIVERSRG